MSLPADLINVSGALELHDFFGYWPSFHDAEIISVHLERSVPSVVKLHTWHMTNDIDAKGYFILTKHVIVEIVLENIRQLNLVDFNHQNVIFELSIKREEDSAYLLTLNDCYGIHGSFVAEGLTIRHYPCDSDGILRS